MAGRVRYLLPEVAGASTRNRSLVIVHRTIIESDGLHPFLATANRGWIAEEFLKIPILYAYGIGGRLFMKNDDMFSSRLGIGFDGFGVSRPVYYRFIFTGHYARLLSEVPERFTSLNLCIPGATPSTTILPESSNFPERTSPFANCTS